MLNFRRGFRVRSRERNLETDSKRRQSIAEATKKALEQIDFEFRGLSARVDEYYARIAVMLDTTGDYGERHGEDEAEIVSSERQLVLARERIEYLKAERLRLEAVLDLVDTDQLLAAG